VSLSGWSVQYASASGTTWLVTDLTGSIAPGGYFLVRMGSGGSAGNLLPTPDSTGTTNMSATSGKVRVNTGATVRDLVGYGSANQSEGGPAPAGSTPPRWRAPTRPPTDNNAADFASGAPAAELPRVRVRLPPRASATSGRGTPFAAGGQPVRRAASSRRRRQRLLDQDPCPDANVATSEGVFVFTASAPTVVAGDDVNVTGTVSEFRPNGATGTSLTTTELTSPSIGKQASGKPLPAATIVGSGGRVPPAAVIDNDATGSVETSGSFDAATDGIDFWESLEGMRVQLANPVVGPRNANGEIPVIPGGSGVRTDRGGIVVQANDFNPERVLLDDRLAPMPTANVGDTFSGALVGVLDYDFGNFKLLPGSTPARVSGGLGPETTTAAGPGQLAVATFNVENLDPADPQSKFDALAGVIVNNLKAPDLLALEEVQDNDGPTNSAVVAADQTIAKLTAAITAAGGRPTRSGRSIPPTTRTAGSRGNIRCVLLYRTDRGLSFVDRPGGTATLNSAVQNVGGCRGCSTPRPDPAHQRGLQRQPQAAGGRIRWNGRTVFVVANHFNSRAATTRSSAASSRPCGPRRRSAISRPRSSTRSWTRSPPSIRARPSWYSAISMIMNSARPRRC
jgi:predicted extracellular nuclease